MAMSAKRFCFQRLLIALLKLSPPGIVTLSPTVRPEMETSRDSSRYLLPEILIPAMVYSLGGFFELESATSSGSTEMPGWVVSANAACMVSVTCGTVSVTCALVESVTWACAAIVVSKQKVVSKKTQNSDLRCIQSV